jgi:hypothetical protein
MKNLILSLIIIGIYSSVFANQKHDNLGVEQVVIDGRLASAKVENGKIIQIIEYQDEPNSVGPASDVHNTEPTGVTFKTNITALEIEDVYDLQVLAYHLYTHPAEQIELSVPNQSKSYTRLTSILGVLQYQGISYKDIKIIVVPLQGDSSDEQIKITFTVKSLDYAVDNDPIPAREAWASR